MTSIFCRSGCSKKISRSLIGIGECPIKCRPFWTDSQLRVPLTPDLFASLQLLNGRGLKIRSWHPSQKSRDSAVLGLRVHLLLSSRSQRRVQGSKCILWPGQSAATVRKIILIWKSIFDFPSSHSTTPWLGGQNNSSLHCVLSCVNRTRRIAESRQSWNSVIDDIRMSCSEQENWAYVG